jgi:uncharacterized membrane protein YGL010W
MSARASRLFSDYASAHATAGNRACHMAGIPGIVFSIVVALTRVPAAGPWSAAEIAIAAVTLVSFSLDAGAAAVLFVFLAASDLVGRAIASWASPAFVLGLAAALFAGGWIFQLVGHSVYEKNRPAFLRNLSHLLIGPLWIARKLLT